MTKHDNLPELLPCPFCGGKGDFMCWKNSNDIFVGRIVCGNDDCSMDESAGDVTEEQAIKAWNQRANTPSLAALDSEEMRETVATEVYESMRWAVMHSPYHEETPPKWTPSGNSLAQDRARDATKAAIAAIKEKLNGN